ncbi:hypothetical protein HAX54_040050 [Datura stramonium]|uniref:Uncharacterized protein n=1 Tax=Datura stramonium TaxID=4076 RepID=A0ABS8SJY3_DATST|nr:hypothetical protein [Datura stramonium]
MRREGEGEGKGLAGDGVFGREESEMVGRRCEGGGRQEGGWEAKVFLLGINGGASEVLGGVSVFVGFQIWGSSRRKKKEKREKEEGGGGRGWFLVGRGARWRYTRRKRRGERSGGRYTRPGKTRKKKEGEGVARRIFTRGKETLKNYNRVWSRCGK